MDLTTNLLVGGVSFGRNIVGIITRPYESYRRIVERGNLWELFFVGLTLAAYFALASLVKTPVFRPFLLTKEFVTLGMGAGLGYLLAVGTLWVATRLAGGQGSLGKLALAWGYTLIPTTVWFFVTSLLYLVLPPPRTTSLLGITFSVAFLVFSATLFWWKLTLAYLSLRFAMKLDFLHILVVAGAALPVLTLYGIWMYRLGIFRVPFL